MGIIPKSTGNMPSNYIAYKYNANDKVLEATLCGIKNLPPYAFSHETYLSNVNFCPELKTIGSQAFDSCSKLNFDALPDSVTTINTNAFVGCTYLGLKKLPSSLASLGNYAFSKCNNISFSDVPANLWYFPTYCFNACNSLTKINFLNKSVTLCNASFANCNGLTEISFAGEIYSSSSYDTPFNGCNALSKITIGGVGSPAVVGAQLFGGIGCDVAFTVYTPGAKAISDAPWGANGTVTYKDSNG